MNDRKGKQDASQSPERPGTGTLCPEAQADGVPCTEVGKDCEVCGRAQEPVQKPGDTEADERAW